MLSNVMTHAATTVSLADYTRPELIVPQLRERDTAGIIGELGRVLQRHGCVPDILPFYQAALNQELLSSSALECGIAFPHGRLSGLRQPQFALGRTREPVIWGADGPWRAQLVFLFAVPATDATGYLQLLARLGKLAQQPKLLASLRAAEDGQAILFVLEQVKLRQG